MDWMRVKLTDRALRVRRHFSLSPSAQVFSIRGRGTKDEDEDEPAPVVGAENRTRQRSRLAGILLSTRDSYKFRGATYKKGFKVRDRAAFDHEKLNVYQVELCFVGWVATLHKESSAC